MKTRRRSPARSVVGKSRNLGNELRKQGNITLSPQKRKSYAKIIPRLTFSRMICEISDDYAAKKRRPNAYRWAATALDTLQSTIEAHLIDLFKKTKILSINANRMTVRPEDLEMILMARDEISLPGGSSMGARRMSPKRKRRSRGRSSTRSAARRISTRKKSSAMKRSVRRSPIRRKRARKNRRKN